MYKKKVQDLQSEIIEKIKEKCSTIIGEDQQITFKNVFSIWITEGMYEVDGRVQYGAYGMLSDGTVMGESFGDSVEFSLGELDIYELAHIIDILESSDFTVEDIQSGKKVEKKFCIKKNLYYICTTIKPKKYGIHN